MDRVIKNFDQLATTPLRRDGLEILEAGYEAVMPAKVLAETVKREGDILRVGDEQINLAEYERVFFVAAGKCAVATATALEPLILDKLTAGLVLDVVTGNFQKIKSLVGTHPVVSEQNLTATKEIVAMLTGLSVKDLVLLAISGGGSALLTMPRALNLTQVKELTELAFSKGMTIEDLNIVRRHLSLVKGGGLAKILYPAAAVALIFSDVPGNDLATIASGPTVFDKTSVSEAQAVIAKYGVFDILSWPGFELVETPKEEKYFAAVKNILLLTNEMGLMAMKTRAEELGYASYLEDESLEGNAGEIGRNLVKTKLPAKSCFIYGGETTVIYNKGSFGTSKRVVGGRCQELALSALSNMPAGELLIAVASDGWDNTEAAGALADRELFTLVPGGEKEIEKYLPMNDSFTFFQKYGGQIITGRTGANVSDFYLIIKN